MWKKLIAVSLSTSLLAGCAGTTTGQDAPQETEQASQEPAETAADSTAARGQGGKPWTDFDLLENISADITLSEKDDLYYAVNKDWLVKNEMPEGRASYLIFNQVKENVEQRAIAILEGKDNSDSHNVRLSRALYSAFLDWDERDRIGCAPMEETVNRIKQISTLEEMDTFLVDPEASYLVDTLFMYGTDSSFQDSSRYTVALMDMGLLLEDAAEYKTRTALGDRLFEGKLHLLKQMLPRIGYTEQQAEDMLNQAIAFESKLAEVCYSSEDQYSPDYTSRVNNPRSPEEVCQALGAYPFQKFMDARGYGSAREYMVTNPDYLEKLAALYTEDNLEPIKNLQIVKYVLDAASTLDSGAYAAYVESQNIINGSSGRVDDKVAAFDTVRKSLSSPMDQAYLETYDYSRLKEQIYNLCVEIKDTYRTMLEDEDWLSEETRQKAIEKLDALQINSLYPDKWIDYSALDLEGLSYYDCMKVISLFKEELDAARTNGTVDPDIWDFDILEMNAYYNPSRNSINMILGIIGEPVYEEGEAEEVLMGTYGSTIGHEISHAFDTNGAQYDKYGNLSSWWTDEDYEAFRQRAQKLIDYYDTIQPWEGTNIDGSIIQTEAIADMGGMKVLLEMAKKRENFDYRTFFRSFASNWARINTFEREEYCITQDSHPLHYLRANVTAQQFEEFYTAFGVKEGDAMYLAPEKRVAVW